MLLGSKREAIDIFGFTRRVNQRFVCVFSVVFVYFSRYFCVLLLMSLSHLQAFL